VQENITGEFYMILSRTFSAGISAGALFLVFGMAGVGYAQEMPDASQTTAAEKEARNAFHQGTAHFRNEEYDQAAAAFRRSYQLNPAWKILYNIAPSEAAAKNYGLSLEAFEKFLTEGGDEISESRQQEVIDEIEKLKTKVGVLKIEAPPNCQVLIDGKVRGQTPVIQKIRVAVAREHSVIVQQGDEILLEQNVTLGSGELRTLSVKNGPTENGVIAKSEPGQFNTAATDLKGPRMNRTTSLAGIDDASTAPAKHGNDHRRKSRSVKLNSILAWGVIGLGGATILAGGVTGIAAYSKKKELLDECPQKDQCPPESQPTIDSGTNLATATAVLLPVGTALAVAGVSLIFWRRHREKASSSKMRFVPMKNRHFTGVSIEGRF
jgi:hypothetical protein